MSTVVYVRSMLTPQKRDVLCLSGSIRSLAPSWDTPFVAFVDGQPVMRADWELVLEDEQSLAFVDVTAMPQGGGGGESDALRIVLTIAVLVFAPEIGAFMGPGMFGAGVLGMSAATWTAVASFAGMALVNALIPPPKPLSPQSSSALAAPSPTYSMQIGRASCRERVSSPV